MSLYLNGASVFAQPISYGGLLNAGQFGLISRGGSVLFDNVLIRGNDPAAATGF